MSIRIKHLRLFLWLLLCFITLSACSSEQSNGLSVGDSLPTLEVLARDGRKVALQEQFTAPLRLVSIRTIGCRYCESDFKELERIRQHFNPKELDVAVIGVACAKEVMDAFLNNKEISFDVFVDEGSEVMRRTHSVLLPIAYLIDPSGTVRYKVQGALSKKEIAEVLPTLLP